MILNQQEIDRRWELLEKQIDRINKEDQEFYQIFITLKNFFTPFVGKKVITKNGCLLEKIKKNLPKVNAYFTSLSNTSLHWKIIGSNREMNLAVLENGILKEFCKIQKNVTYNKEMIKILFHQYALVHNHKENLKNQLKRFQDFLPYGD